MKLYKTICRMKLIVTIGFLETKSKNRKNRLDKWERDKTHCNRENKNENERKDDEIKSAPGAGAM